MMELLFVQKRKRPAGGFFFAAALAAFAMTACVAPPSATNETRVPADFAYRPDRILTPAATGSGGESDWTWTVPVDDETWKIRVCREGRGKFAGSVQRLTKSNDSPLAEIPLSSRSLSRACAAAFDPPQLDAWKHPDGAVLIRLNAAAFSEASTGVWRFRDGRPDGCLLESSVSGASDTPERQQREVVKW